jgi:hypothetical protein
LIGSFVAAFVEGCDRRGSMAKDRYRGSVELHRDLIAGPPLAGAAYSQIVPTRFEGAATVVGFVYGFSARPEGGSVDSPSDVRYLDLVTGTLLEEHRYTGEHRSHPAPKTNAAARVQMYTLQDALIPHFFSDPGKLNSQEEVRLYLQTIPEAVGSDLLVYYEELAPDWFAWLRAAR